MFTTGIKITVNKWNQNQPHQLVNKGPAVICIRSAPVWFLSFTNTLLAIPIHVNMLKTCKSAKNIDVIVLIR